MIISVPISTVLAFLPAVLGIPTLNTRQDTKAVEIEVELVGDTSKVSIAVIDQETSEVLGRSCSSTLNSGGFANFPIATNLDIYGGGKITVGPTVYEVHENPEFSGGITCSRIYNDAGAFVTCTASIPVSLQATALGKSSLPGCFAKGATSNLKRASKSIRTANSSPEPAIAPLNETVQQANHSLHARQYECSQWNYYTRNVGDGNPHQNYWDKQLSENINCGASPSCSVGHEQSSSFSVEWSASAAAFEWISGGFAVQEEWTTGNEYTCFGNQGDTVCVWYNTAHTAYTVQNWEENVCTSPTQSGDPYVMFSPNQNNAGGGYYCVVGTCRSEGQGYWDKSGPAGGPP
ncbi:hypothetical protein Asppvi_003719 [Aspergillus pseudoviridinutans]|uniref:Ig-like domain-containing protein n=1 Tax=Aspergillus pseudoviridinutans TaxID=1517512 RepID=A0A9P3B8Y4_9EURO|nr:uncharacterized protein Asppvi_003719 [Aspergillus pseudoviridinutans]GIJ84868.1 hypothetical protein Asppvi_003719 [Aspergillus pseudoviridinutans]